jgi:hypothetical protein
VAVGVLAIVAALALTPASGASAGGKLPPSYPNRFCSGTFQARGEPWGYDGRNISCHWQGVWAADFVRNGVEPRHWRCYDLGDSGRCHSKHTYDRGHVRKWFEFYAED